MESNTPRTSLKIGVSGVRGVAGEALTPQIVTSFAAAFGTYCGPGPVPIGTDTRPSREMLTQATIAGLLSVGCQPVRLGVTPSPALQMYSRQVKSVGSICVSGSHNPAEWNALKFFGSDGILLRPNQFAELLDLYHQGTFSRVSASEIQTVTEDGSAVERHREAVLAAIDQAAIRERRFKVAIDCCNGAASLAAPVFLRELGCEVVESRTDPDGTFPQDPEPRSKNLTSLSTVVRESGADLGFALDADADRVGLVSETGEAQGEDLPLAIVVRHILRKKPGPVVVHIATSQMIEDIAREFGVPVLYTPVGEIHVLDQMLESNAPVGGEGTGGVIVPAVNPCRDSFVAMAFILEALALENEPLTALRERLPRYALVRRTLPCRPRTAATWLRLLRQRHRNETLDLTDGVKVLWDDCWLHIRGSNTDALLRVTAEAKSAERAERLVQDVLDALASSRG